MLDIYRTRLPSGGSVLWLNPNLSPVYLQEVFPYVAPIDRVIINWVEFEVSNIVALSRVKYWNGSAWVVGNTKYWNGSAWITAQMKYWNGSAWI